MRTWLILAFGLFLGTVLGTVISTAIISSIKPSFPELLFEGVEYELSAYDRLYMAGERSLQVSARIKNTDSYISGIDVGINESWDYISFCGDDPQMRVAVIISEFTNCEMLDRYTHSDGESIWKNSYGFPMSDVTLEDIEFAVRLLDNSYVTLLELVQKREE